MTVRLPGESLLPVPAGKWQRLDGEIEVTYTPEEWALATLFYDEVVMWRERMRAASGEANEDLGEVVH